MNAEIVSIGTEILLGEIIDTNSVYIAERLPALGIDVFYKHVVGDNLTRLSEVIGRARERADLVITTGGLGPTEDDLTREAIAAVHGETTSVDPELETWLRGLYQRRGAVMPERNIKQTWLIPSARAIANPRGTAPGWWVETDGKIVIAMPGPPAEMNRMWDEEVAPELAKRYHRYRADQAHAEDGGLRREQRGRDDQPAAQGAPTRPSVIYARADGVHVRMGAKAATPQEARALIAPVEARCGASWHRTSGAPTTTRSRASSVRCWSSAA